MAEKPIHEFGKFSIMVCSFGEEVHNTQTPWMSDKSMSMLFTFKQPCLAFFVLFVPCMFLQSIHQPTYTLCVTECICSMVYCLTLFACANTILLQLLTEQLGRIWRQSNICSDYNSKCIELTQMKFLTCYLLLR